MSSVTDITQTETHFIAEIVVCGCRVFFNVPKADLHAGASLIRLKNAWVRDVLAANRTFIAPDQLRDAAKEALPLLRDQIESYFADMGTENDETDA